MVALDKQFDHHGTKPRSSVRWRDESWQTGKSAERRAADILSARSPRDTSNSSSSSCANEIIYCGYRFDPDTQLYYVRNRSICYVNRVRFGPSEAIWHGTRGFSKNWYSLWRVWSPSLPHQEACREWRRLNCRVIIRINSV